MKVPRALNVLVRFKPDLNLMKPCGLSGQSCTRGVEVKWMKLADGTSRPPALVGSPFATGGTAVAYHACLKGTQPDEVIELQTSPEAARNSYIPIVVSGNLKGRVMYWSTIFDGRKSGLRSSAGMSAITQGMKPTRFSRKSGCTVDG